MTDHDAEAALSAVAGLRAAGTMDHLPLGLLTRGRLLRDPAELAKARTLIEACGYFRRLPELEDAERAVGA